MEPTRVNFKKKIINGDMSPDDVALGVENRKTFLPIPFHQKTIEEKLSVIIDDAKYEEMLEAVKTRQKWRSCSYVFEVFTYIFNFSTLAFLAANISFPEYNLLLSYGGTVSQSVSLTSKGLAIWCTSKHKQQTGIINSLIDSARTPYIPDTSIIGAEQK